MPAWFDYLEDGCRGERPVRPRIRTEPEWEWVRVHRVWTMEVHPRAAYLVMRRVNDELTLALQPAERPEP